MRRTASLCVVALLLVPILAQADIPPFMSYQGVLKDAAGNPVPDGTYSVEFNLYEAGTGGTTLWTEPHALQATGGIIEAALGTVTPLNALPFDVPYWLGISVDGEPELTPLDLQNNASIEAAHSKGGTLEPMLKDALEHELQAVIEYKNQIQNIAFTDPATRLLLEGILAEKERQAEEIRHLLGV